MKYSDYLLTDHWKKTKKRHYSIKRNKKCYICSATENLHVHHRYYYRNRDGRVLFKEKPKTLLTLCKYCHEYWHKYHHKKKLSILKSKYKRRILLLKKWLGYSNEEAIKCCLGRIYTEKEKLINCVRLRLKESRVAGQKSLTTS